ncbi:WXG100 family type VII secretion target [Micromonospora viridifaciens]|uniref:WXG100 family type VII secretion target n=1 Tax=Micromonospora viridifaciens TaxID=1881 RepID=A0A1C5A0A5_MICVI|nr:WXG100 family type VII secretion target [Micromonospora viridifaciens]SCF38615.1 WXG100 family type VII secretion target [Micromonospora viridifaciens]
MSEYTQRYEHVSHKELYQSVNAGDPKQVDTLSAQWSSMKDTLEGLGRDLAGDLDALTKTWTGDAAREFQQRVNLIVEYSGNLAHGMAGIRQALDMMATELRTAQANAESPEETDDNDKMLSGAGKGFLFGGAVGAVIGGVVGHQQDKAEQEKAHQRMVQVVANLAEGYDFSAYGRVVVPEPPDPRLPGHTNSSGPTLGNGPSVGTPSSGPTSGTFAPTQGATATTNGVQHTAPNSGTVDGGAPGAPGTGSPGTIGSVGVVDPVGTSLAGAGPLTPTGLAPTGLTSATPTVPTGGGSLYGMPGLVGTGSLAGAGTPPSGRAGGMAGLDNRSAAGTGRLSAGRGVVAESEGRSNNARGTTGRAAMAGRNGVLGGRQQHDEDESDERLTWLTEDEMVWDDGRPAPPPVLGTD